MRKPLLYVAVGMKGSGKSRRTITILRAYRDQYHRKVLLMDNQNEYSEKQHYPDVRTLGHNNIALFCAHSEISIRRIPPFKSNGEEMIPDEKAKMVLHILQYFHDGLLLLEDINDYVYDYVDPALVGKILSQRHKGTDLIMHFHSLGAIQKKLWRHIDVIRLHKTEDNVIDNRDKFSDKYEMFRIGELLVNKQYDQGNAYFNIELHMPQRKIVGGFSSTDRDEAIDEYISLHYTKQVNPYLNRRARGGKTQYTEETAFEAEHQRILKMYFHDD
jgi:hypothetical protein